MLRSCFYLTISACVVRMSLDEFKRVYAGYTDIYRALLRHCITDFREKSTFLGAYILRRESVERKTHHIIHTMFTSAAFRVFPEQFRKSYFNNVLH